MDVCAIDRIFPPHKNRILCIVLACFLIGSGFCIIALNAEAAPKAEFLPPHSDYGRDENGNGCFDWLCVDAVVNTSVAGWYFLEGYLYDPVLNYMGSDDNYTYLGVGIQTITLEFYGIPIYNNGADGQYVVELYIYDGYGPILDGDTHTTNPYLYTEFEYPGATFNPPHSDYGQDNDGDGLNDWLVVEMNIDVKTAGDYYVIYFLYDDSWNYITLGYSNFHWDIGPRTAAFGFNGILLHNFGFNGTYIVELFLYDSHSYQLDYNLHNTNYYAWTEFEPPGATFSPPHKDHGLDTNGNGFFDWLVVDVTVNVLEAGWYDTTGILYDNSSNFIDFNHNLTYLDAGYQVVALQFQGSYIYSNGEDGPYIVYLNMYDDSSNHLGDDTHTTDAYLYTEFEHVSQFEPPHSDYGVDADGNGKYDMLVVEVNVSIATDGWYCVVAELYDSSFELIDTDYNFSYLGIGSHAVTLRFSGLAIYRNGVGGPFDVSLALYDENFDMLDYDVHTTAAYSYTQFDSDGALFSPPHFDYGLDTNASGLYESLVMGVGVYVSTPGSYRIEGYLLDYGLAFVDYFENHTTLTAGYHTVFLQFSGPAIYAHGIDGQFLVVLNLSDAARNWLDSDFYETGWYSYTDFEQGIPNTPPDAAFTVTPPYGTTSTVFSFDPSGSSDAEDPYDLLQGRWDWNGDGTWDTAWGPLGIVTHSYPADGIYDVSLQVRDTGGLTNKETHSVIVDSVSPTTSVSLSGTAGLNGWYLSNVTVTLSALDSGSGVDYTRYRIDGGSWQTYTAPLVISAEGNHTVDYYSVDIVGNVEPTKSANVKIDKTPPTTSASGYMYNVTLTATDNAGGSGVDRIMYRIDSGSWQVYTGTINAGTSGSHNVSFYAVDKAGNVESTKWIMTPIPDTTKPVTSIALAGTLGSNGWYVSSVTVTLNASDSGSGVDETMYRINGGSWQTYTAPVEITANGIHTFEYRSVDVAGNSEDAKSAQIKIDTVAPALSITETNGTSFAPDSVVIHWAASDATSGIADILISVDGGAFQSKGAVMNVTLDGLSAGEHTITVRVIDNAGLVTEKTLSFNVTEGAGAGALDWTLIMIIIVVVIAGVVAAIFLMKRKKGPSVSPKPSEPEEAEYLPPPPPDE
ncbi:MAG: Ig-like domain-containing protein [Thermoplasmata archaeon]